MKAITDRHRRDHEFQVGEWVLVKLWPYRQSTISGTAQSKLSKHFYRPFRISVRMGTIAYKLALPEHSRIHPVFHCSILKPFIGPLDAVQVEDLPLVVVDNQPVPIPLAILAHKTIPSNTNQKQLVLVHWKGLHPNETSWEEWTSLQNLHHLEEKVLFEARGNVTSSNNELQVAKPNVNNSKELPTIRPKRQSHTPNHLKDFVLVA